MKWKIIFFLFLAHVIDLEKTCLAAEYHRSGTFSLCAMSLFGIFVKFLYFAQRIKKWK